MCLNTFYLLYNIKYKLKVTTKSIAELKQNLLEILTMILLIYFN